MNLSQWGERLEDTFFVQQDKKLIEQLREIKKMTQTKEELSKISGITDEKVLDNLISLNIRPEIIAALAIVPLIEVAWADGKVDKKEKDAVIAAAREKIPGQKNDGIIELLQEWLDKRPSSDLFNAWRHYTASLCEKLKDKDKNALKSEIIGHARDIAAASGGFLGMGSISSEEETIIEELEKAFGN